MFVLSFNFYCKEKPQNNHTFAKIAQWKKGRCPPLPPRPWRPLDPGLLYFKNEQLSPMVLWLVWYIVAPCGFRYHRAVISVVQCRSSQFQVSLCLVWSSVDPQLWLVWYSVDPQLWLVWYSVDPQLWLVWYSADPHGFRYCCAGHWAHRHGRGDRQWDVLQEFWPFGESKNIIWRLRTPPVGWLFFCPWSQFTLPMCVFVPLSHSFPDTSLSVPTPTPPHTHLLLPQTEQTYQGFSFKWLHYHISLFVHAC